MNRTAEADQIQDDAEEVNVSSSTIMADRWIFQNKFYNGESKMSGNCLQAAVASILNKPLAVVPNFNYQSGEITDPWAAIQHFFFSHGYRLKVPAGEESPDRLYLAAGPANRGVMHCVVMLSGKLVHDPHPSGDGLISILARFVPEPLGK